MKLLSKQVDFVPYNDDDLAHVWGDTEYGNHLELDEDVDEFHLAMEPPE